MIIKKPVNIYTDYVGKQNTRGSINDSTLRFNKSIENLFAEYNIQPDDYILDVGTRNGSFIKDLHDSGYKNSYGIDISEGASILWKQWGDDLLQFFKVEDAQINLNPFGFRYKFISLSHVLEHMHDVDKVLENIKDCLLDDSSIVYIVVPQEDNVKHEAHYTSFPAMEDLATLFKNHSFEILHTAHKKSFQAELQLIAKVKK